MGVTLSRSTLNHNANTFVSRPMRWRERMTHDRDSHEYLPIGLGEMTGIAPAAVEAAAPILQTASGGSIRAGVWTGVVLAGIGVVSLIIRQWGPWQVIAGTQRRADIEGMGKRIAELETRLDRQSIQHEQKIEQERREHAAELQIMRHRMNNLDQCLTMLLALIELDPERARDSAARVRQMRERQEANEIAEKGAIAAARLAPAIKPHAPESAPLI